MRKILLGLSCFALAIMVMPRSAHAYSYAGYRWPGSYPNMTVAIDFSTIPYAWSTPFGYAMGAWNNAGSKARFSVSSGGGHTVSLKFAWFASWLAQTRIASSGGSIYDVDTVFNNRWSWDVNGASNKYDAWSVMTHELGHWLTLNDLYNSWDYWKTMYGVTAPGLTYQRTLDSDDINGIRAIYGVR